MLIIINSEIDKVIVNYLFIHLMNKYIQLLIYIPILSTILYIFSEVFVTIYGVCVNL